MRTEYGWPTGTSVCLDISGSAVFPGLSEYVRTGFDEFVDAGLKRSDTWQCNYCGTSHWVEDRELQCKKCGGPRDV